jgi:hypothetical protein
LGVKVRLAVYEFTLFVGASLVANWIWDFWTKRSAAKRHKDKMLKSCRLEKIEHCAHELDYNATPGIGRSRSPFTTASLQKFYIQKK